MEALLQEPNIERNLVYTLPRKVTIDTSTRIFQCKILNNILYLNNRQDDIYVHCAEMTQKQFCISSVIVVSCKIVGRKCKIGSATS